MNIPPQKPSYPLKDVKQLIRANHVFIQPNAIVDAWDDFGWRSDDIKKCLLKLNDKYYSHNREKNHFHKTKPHRQFPDTMLDYYKAKNIMGNNSDDLVKSHKCLFTSVLSFRC